MPPKLPSCSGDFRYALLILFAFSQRVEKVGLVEPGYGAEAARALFAEVYRHWTKLPKESRPRLYLHGLSLGALSSEQSAELFEVIGDPYHGALWSGPPFPSRIWRAVTSDRSQVRRAWLPGFRGGSYVRVH